jgi:insulin-like growth factor-binding protein complex acid labile subunit
MKSLKQLWLNGNQVKSIEKDSFLGLESLEALYLQVNQVQTIQNETFSNLKSLKVLYLQENRLILLESEAFEGLTKLEILQLDLNFIKDLNVDIFENLTSLNTLQIGYNEVKSLNKYLFRHPINQYQAFSLKSNRIEQIETGTFRNALNLTKIDLSQNRLNKIEKYSFQNFPSLNTLNLSQNYLDQLIDVFDENVTILTLDLSFNLVKMLENNNGFKLINLHLYHNGLKQMKGEFFKGNIFSQFCLNSIKFRQKLMVAQT